VDVDELVASGLYDPADADAAERLELFEHLFERGATLELIQQRLAAGDELFMVATSLTRSWPTARSVADLASGCGVPPETVGRMRLALGFAVDDVTAPTVRFMLPEDVALFQGASDLFGEDRVLAFTRVLGSSAGRIADAANALFGDRMAEGQDRRPSMLELSQANEMAIAALEAVPDMLLRTVIEHLGGILRRLPDLIDARVHTAVGFVDLVDSTRWATSVSMREHGQALARFETAAWDSATRHGGRVVKMIGDEAMFVADDVGVAARIAAELCAVAERDEALPLARGAIGHGPVTVRDGDYFGPVVNAVARAAKLAGPGQVMALAPAHQDLPASAWMVAAPTTVELRGLDDPVEIAAITPVPSAGR
jgi:class 3 adenylate cyclase